MNWSGASGAGLGAGALFTAGAAFAGGVGFGGVGFAAGFFSFSSGFP
ncbi:MAG TPA: hypothetical protein VFT43_02675 [Candidatus Polarisedimenticolia bacterium]|nr:hypothetical protein [Candidatus Polarisedimenticolia bacterium]